MYTDYFTVHSYQNTFEPNPHWSEFYASSTEIQTYLAHVVEKYGVSRFVKTSHKVVECSWGENVKKWYVLGTTFALINITWHLLKMNESYPVNV
jgi:cation diffusion facilitator CzcD-associated flavoprotein CzcO